MVTFTLVMTSLTQKELPTLGKSLVTDGVIDKVLMDSRILMAVNALSTMLLTKMVSEQRFRQMSQELVMSTLLPLHTMVLIPMEVVTHTSHQVTSLLNLITVVTVMVTVMVDTVTGGDMVTRRSLALEQFHISNIAVPFA